MDRFLSRYDQKEEESLVVVNDAGRYKIYLRELVYIETCKRNLLLHTEGDEILCYKTMREMEKELAGKGFLRSHASYLVNPAFIKSVKKLDIQMLNGEILPSVSLREKALWRNLQNIGGGTVYDCVLDGLSFILEWVYVFVFFRIWYSFLPLRKNRIMKILAVIPFSFMAVCVIYSNELTNLTFLLIGMIVYVIVFHRGAWVEKATAVLIFYPALVAVNYLMLDSGMKFFYFYSGLPYGEDSALHPETLLSSTVIHTMTLLFRLLFWIGAGAFLKKYFGAGSRNLTTKMWLVIDGLMASSFLAVFTIIILCRRKILWHILSAEPLFLPVLDVFIWFIISVSLPKLHIGRKALASQQIYYQERIEDERRVRSIYHDLKNHLLVLQAQSNSRQGQEAIQSLQEQVEMYESYYQTGNETLNVLLRDKARIAREKSIDFSAIVHFEDGKFLETLWTMPLKPVKSCRLIGG